MLHQPTGDGRDHPGYRCNMQVNDLGYRLHKVRKCRPLKKIPETDAIFATVHRINQAADQNDLIAKASRHQRRPCRTLRYVWSGHRVRKMGSSRSFRSPKRDDYFLPRPLTFNTAMRFFGYRVVRPIVLRVSTAHFFSNLPVPVQPEVFEVLGNLQRPLGGRKQMQYDIEFSGNDTRTAHGTKHFLQCDRQYRWLVDGVTDSPSRPGGRGVELGCEFLQALSLLPVQRRDEDSVQVDSAHRLEAGDADEPWRKPTLEIGQEGGVGKVRPGRSVVRLTQRFYSGPELFRPLGPPQSG